MNEIKGTSKKIIEILNPEHEYIEKVLVILKADSPSVKISTKKKQAEKYVEGLVCWKKSILPFSLRPTPKKTALFIIAAAVAAILIAYL